MLSQALIPYVLGRAVDDGLANGDDRSALLLWAGALLALGSVQAVAGVMRHRCAVSNWLQASFRLDPGRLAPRRERRAGRSREPADDGRGRRHRLERRDERRRRVRHHGPAGRARSSPTSSSPPCCSRRRDSSVSSSSSASRCSSPASAFVIRPLQARQREQREEVGRLTALGADTVAGPAGAPRNRRRVRSSSIATEAARSRYAARECGSRCHSRRSTPRKCSCPGSSS